MAEQTWTLGGLLDWTAKHLAQKELEYPRLDAEVLLSHAVGCKRIDLYGIRFADVATPEQRQKYRELIQKRLEGCPVAYLVGKKDRPEYLWREGNPVNSYESSFELAFLPADHSEMENVAFSYVYRVQGGLWLRVNHSRDHEGAGVDEGMFLLDLRKGKPLFLAGATEIRMY